MTGNCDYIPASGVRRVVFMPVCCQVAPGLDQKFQDNISMILPGNGCLTRKKFSNAAISTAFAFPRK